MNIFEEQRVNSRVDFSLPEKLDCHAHSVPLAMTRGTNTSLVKGRGTASAVEGLSFNKQSPLLFPPLTRGGSATAFTLAEVLITLGIIGIVAAMTLPTLIQNYQKKQTVTQLKKAYSQLAQALKLSEVTNGEVQYWNLGAPSGEFANKYVLPYLKHSKILPVSEINSNTKYRFFDGTYASAASGFYGGTAIEIADGTIITVDSWTPSDNSFRTFYIDINGYKKPNVFGKDMFVFWLRSGADLKPYFHQYTREELLFDTSLLQRCTKDKTSFAGMGCAAVIMFDGWEIKDDYPW